MSREQQINRPTNAHVKADNSTSSMWTIAAASTLVAVASAALLVGRKKQSQGEEDTWDSHVKEHGSLQEIHANLYILEAAGCDRGPPKRNMMIYKVPDGSSKDHRLVIFNGIAVNEATLEEIEQLGKPTVLVVPNWHHMCCAGVWKRRYPDITVVCPEVAKDSVETIAALLVDASTQEWSQMSEWSKYIHIREIDGWAPFETVMEVELEANGKGKKAVLVADLLFTIPYCKEDGVVGKLITWIFDSSIDLPNDDDDTTMIVPKVSRIARWFGIKNWKLAEQWYRKYAKNEGSKIAAILVGHGVPVKELNATDGCTKALEGVADQLVKPRW